MEAQQILIQAKKIYPNTTWKINHFKKEADREYPQDSKKEFLFTLNDFNFCFKNEEAKEYFSAYIGGLIEDFYKVINEMIIVLDNGNHSIIQQKEMKDLLPEMAEYFFDNFSPETTDIVNFALPRDTGWELKEGQGIYIKHKNFTKDYVLGIIQTLLSNEKNNLEKEEKKKDPAVTHQMFIDIGIVLASKEFNEMKKSEKNDTEITKHFFPHLTEETYPTLGTVRNYLNTSYGSLKGRFWIYGGRNTDKLMQVFDAIEEHYKNNNKEIYPDFKKRMNEKR